jgi:hypothetical protein
LLIELTKAISTPRAVRPCPELWDGATAQRCLADLRRRSGPALLPTAKQSPAELVAELARRYGGEERRVSGLASYRRSS